MYPQLTKNQSGPLHYLGNRFLTLPNLLGQMSPDTSWLEEQFYILLSNTQGKKYRKVFEPFAGSASWSLCAMELGIAEEYCINDSNKILIHTLELIKRKPEDIKKTYSAFVHDFNNAAHKKEFFLQVIHCHNQTKNDEEKALILPFIINHSWSGILFYDNDSNILYREEELFEGEKAHRYLDEATLSIDSFFKEINRVFLLLNKNKITFTSGDFLDSLQDLQPGDFVAINPPYPENNRFENGGMYRELYSPKLLHERIVNLIETMEKKGIHYYMTYGFYNPEFHEYVLRDVSNTPLNFFRILGYENCAFGKGLDQMYFTSQFEIPLSVQKTIIEGSRVLSKGQLSVTEAFDQFNVLAK